MDLIKHVNDRNRAERLSKLFWLIATVPIGFGLMQFTEFGLLIFPSVRDFLSENVRVLPAGFWPTLMFAFGAGFGLLGFFKFTPLRITTVRIIVQIVVFALFMLFVFATSFTQLSDRPRMQFWLSKFLEIDPLVSIATAITTHTVYKGLIWSLILLVPTLFLGRIFCNWICPYGIIHQFVGWLFGARDEKQRIEANRYRWYYSIKYFILIGMIAAALFGNLAIGLLDPICLLHRSFTAAILPTINMPLQGIFGDYKMHVGGWIIGFIILAFVGLNLVIPRFFCRVLCPLGATLGILSRFAFWRIERDTKKCTDCDMCLQSCEGASDPHTQLRMSECFVCFNCIEDCPEDALSFAFLPKKQHEVREPDIKRRHAIFAALIGALFFGFTKVSGKSTKNFSTKVIRPPGTVEEQEFLKRCIKCDQCIRVCPTNVLQPALFESGLEGLWTPVMNFRMGFCQLNCTACGQVCPTGAIQRITVEEKVGLGSFIDDGPVKLGTAHYDFGRCLPWSKNIPCVVCEEVCPTSPKAIHSERRKLMVREGKMQVAGGSDSTITLREYPKPGEAIGHAVAFVPNQFSGDQTMSYHVEIIRREGRSGYRRITGNSTDSLTLEGPFGFTPVEGDVAVIYNEFKVPKIDTEYCIGCGICEHECPVNGDRRAVYVTAEGETRSQHYLERDRNRSVRLQKSADASSAMPGDLSLSGMILASQDQDGCGSGCGCNHSQTKDLPVAPLEAPTIDLRRFLG